jgi:hypothetical protein
MRPKARGMAQAGRPAQYARGEGWQAVICTLTEAEKKGLYRLAWQWLLSYELLETAVAG